MDCATVLDELHRVFRIPRYEIFAYALEHAHGTQPHQKKLAVFCWPAVAEGAKRLRPFQLGGQSHILLFADEFVACKTDVEW